MPLSKDILYVSQKEVIKYILDNPFLGVFCDMGFGKTIVTLTAIEELIKTKEIKKVMVVSTLLVSRDTWPEEFANWEHTKNISFSFIHGTKNEREEKLKGDESVHIINQENWVGVVEFFGDKFPYDMLIFDDAQGFKNSKMRNKPKKAICIHDKTCPIYIPEPKSKACSMLCNDFKTRPPRFSRFGAVCNVRPKLKRLLHLTGTPSSKKLLDIFPLFFTLDMGERLGKSFHQYKQRYFNQAYNGFGWKLRDGSEEKIHEKIKDLCIAIESEAELPPCHHIKVPIKFGPKEEKIYRELEKNFIIELESQEVTALNAGALAGKLLQACGGALYTDDSKDWVTLHDEKIKALQTIVRKHEGEPILIGYNFKHELKRLKKHFPEGIDIRERKDVVRAWNAGKIDILFAHPASAGHGLNLQKGPGHVLVWFGLNWALDMNKQLNKRLHRPGQKREVFIYSIVAKGKIDERVLKAVEDKDTTQNDLLTAVRVDIKKRIKKV